MWTRLSNLGRNGLSISKLRIVIAEIHGGAFLEMCVKLSAMSGLHQSLSVMPIAHCKLYGIGGYVGKMQA